PERSPGGIHDLRRGHERAGTQRVAETSREAERDELSLGKRKAGAETDQGCFCTCLTRCTLFDFQCADKSECISLRGKCVSSFRDYRSVHARLRTVSLTLEVVAMVADGSKPEWMPQCPQRGAVPGPAGPHP